MVHVSGTAAAPCCTVLLTPWQYGLPTRSTHSGALTPLQGGAIFWSYCNGATPTMTQNRFISNTASMFKGQIG